MIKVVLLELDNIVVPKSGASAPRGTLKDRLRTPQDIFIVYVLCVIFHHINI